MTEITVPSYDVSFAPPAIPAPLAAALVAAWGELGNVVKVKTADAGSYKYAYSGLDDVLDVIRPVLAKHGLALFQPAQRHEMGAIVIDTIIQHTSGHRLSWSFEVAAGGNAQASGSAISYARRYTLMAALGIASEGDDDDGKAAAKTPAAPPARRERRKADPDDEGRRRTRHAMALFNELGIGDRDDRNNVTSAILGREIGSWTDTTPIEQMRVIDELIVRRDEERAADDLAAQWDALQEQHDGEG